MTGAVDAMTAVVDVSDGPVRGRVRDGMNVFLGIPYAAPPVGDLRWRPPAPVAAWSEPLDAVDFGDVCAQDSTGLPGFGHVSETEDCLYLNVYSPAGAGPDDGRPVMVWFPGGGLYCGGSNGYDPGELVRGGDVVFVSLNYRLNVFGFFSHPEINAEGHAAGNYGIMDQQAALRWVRRNIARFGGDPDNVTIFGESAGAISVLANLASPTAEGLFHRAILQSCSVAATTPTADITSREDVGQALAAAAGCATGSATELRALSTREVMAADGMAEALLAVGKFPIGLVADGTIIPDSLGTLFSTGRFHHVPVINGVNRDEFAWFQAMIELGTGQVVSEADYPHVIAPTFELMATSPLLGVSVPASAAPEILARYPVTEHPSPSRALAAAIGDCGFVTSGGRMTTRALERAVPGQVWAYEWDVPDSPVSWPDVSFPYGSGHVQELQYLFRGFHGGSGIERELSLAQQELARTMVRYWTTFARHGTPNDDAADVPEWPAYEPERDNVMTLHLPEPTVTENFGATHHCDFWDQFWA